MSETITVRFLGREVVCRLIYQGEYVTHYMGDVGECVLEATCDDDVWSAEFEGKHCGGQTLEQAIAKLEAALAPVARVLAPLCANWPEERP